jgi:protein-S-isoprenylcysteine O-methyltransferase Ste14
MIWLPPFAIFLVFCARIFELNYPFPATSGRIESRYTFTSLTLLGAFTVVAAFSEYIWIRPAPNWFLFAGGLALALIAFALRAAARKALGLMWSVHVEIREKHVLVQHGPYVYVRHPIYVAAFLELIAIPITLGSWRSGIVCAALYVVALAVRVHTEERAMAAQLGSAWTDYCQRTGAFLPRW